MIYRKQNWYRQQFLGTNLGMATHALDSILYLYHNFISLCASAIPFLVSIIFGENEKIELKNSWPNVQILYDPILGAELH